MARKRKTTQRKAPTPPPSRGGSDRDKAIDALMALLAEHSFQEIGLAEGWPGAPGLKLSQLRAEFGSTLAILGAHHQGHRPRRARRRRCRHCGGAGARAAVRRSDAPARSTRALQGRGAFAAALGGAQSGSRAGAQRHGGALAALELEAAGVGASGPRGALRAQGAALMFARVVSVWIDDDEEGLDRTMAALDRGLASAGRWAGFLDDLCSLPKCVMRGRHRRRPIDEGAAEADAGLDSRPALLP